MKKWLTGFLAFVLTVALFTPVYAALPSGAGVIKSSSDVSGSEFSSRSSIAKKLDKMFAGDIGLYKDKKKTKPVDAALGTKSVPNNGVWQYWGPETGAATSCFAYANAFYGHFYDGVYPHRSLNGNHKKVKATGKITYANLKKWGVRDDAAVYIREGNHSIILLHYDENYITYIDGNGDGKGLVALRKEVWGKTSGSNIYNQKPSLIVQPTTAYFPAGSMGKKQAKPCTQGGTSHDWDDGTVTQKATCKEAGVKTYTCLDCQKTKEESVKKTDEHAFGDWSVKKEATCDKSGTKISACAVCGKTQTKTLKKLGHHYGKGVKVRETTIYSAGITEKTCSRCGKVQKTKTDCAYRDQDLGITLTTKEKVFPKNTQVTVFMPGEYTEQQQTLLREISGKFCLYDISAQVKEERVQPKGEVTLELKLPEGFGQNVQLYALAEGAALELESAYDPEENILTAKLKSFTLLALCDLDIPPQPQPTQPETEPETQPETAAVTQPETVATADRPAAEKAPNIRAQRYMVLAGVAVTVLVAAVIALIILLKKEKQNEASSEEECDSDPERSEGEKAVP